MREMAAVATRRFARRPKINLRGLFGRWATITMRTKVSAISEAIETTKTSRK